MEHSIEHKLPLALAKKATEKAFAAYANRFAKYHPSAKWTGNYAATISFEAKGVRLEGNITLREGAIDLEMDVPLVFKPFRSKALDIIEEEIEKWIAKAEAGELDS